MLKFSHSAMFFAAFSLSLSAAPVITQNSDASSLVASILGPGVTLVGVPVFTGLSVQGGVFSGATPDIGIASGVILTSGNVNEISGANSDITPETVGGADGEDSLDSSLGQPGDGDLSGLAGGETNDAALLTFSFQFGDGSIGGDLFFNYVFASEEYIDYVDSSFNDVFGFFLNGENIALLPNGDPVSINNLSPNKNSSLYINNVPNAAGLPVKGAGIQFDGFTTILQASKMGLGSGVHTIKLAVADVSDSALDSAVFIQAGTFSNQPTEPIPEPATVVLCGGAFALLAFGRYRRTARNR